jgi:hypothetical protein
MSRGISIRFKNGKIASVSGARTPKQMTDATAFGEAFLSAFPTTPPAAGQAVAKKVGVKKRKPVHCIRCDGPVFNERDEFGRECSAADGDLCIWSDTRTPYPPTKKRKK